MFCHLCFNNQEDSEIFLGLVLEEIHNAEYDGMRPYFAILLPLLDLPDIMQVFKFIIIVIIIIIIIIVIILIIMLLLHYSYQFFFFFFFSGMAC